MLSTATQKDRENESIYVRVVFIEMKHGDAIEHTFKSFAVSPSPKGHPPVNAGHDAPADAVFISSIFFSMF